MMGSPTLPITNTMNGYREPQRTRRFLKLPVWLIAAGAVLLYLQLAVLPTYFYATNPSQLRLSEAQLVRLHGGLAKCAEFNSPFEYELPSESRSNPRWNSVTGQKGTVVLKNATLFDGENFVSGPVDITFEKGIVTAVSTASSSTYSDDTEVVDLHGKYVTPGLVDMHSHHLVESWPQLSSNSDGNEVHKNYGPLTPFVRSIDSMRGDPATLGIASGGITTGLVLPGSANIMGGEAYPVKNYEKGGKNGEEVVEELLLEHGIPEKQRRRYLKMACGENPRRVYSHTRMGNAWEFRKHMTRALELKQKQESWCLSAEAANANQDTAAIASLTSDFSSGTFGLPEELELDSTLAMLRGKININVHCYEPEDFEDMLHHSNEFGFQISAFHHALEAWQVPEMIKEYGGNITIATFAEFSLYKTEAYGANLYAGKILAEHGLPVAYKSDHSDERTFAKYLLSQAAIGHSFHLPGDIALQSVTSVPANSMGLGHRIGYARVGYDADIVVWDSHPLSVGATPQQVYIDGRPLLDSEKVAESMPDSAQHVAPTKQQPKFRVAVDLETKAETCKNSVNASKRTVITGIKKSFLDPAVTTTTSDLTIVLENSKITYHASNTFVSTEEDHVINLENGHVLPGLTAVSTEGFGLREIEMESSTSDGDVSNKVDPSNEDNVVFAKYGVHLEGRLFTRARYGGVTRAVTVPTGGGFLHGVSTGIKTSGNSSILDGGIFQDDVALHFTVGQGSKASESISTISNAVLKLRNLLLQNRGKDGVYGKAARGEIPVVVNIESKYDIQQIIKLKRDLKDVKFVILGGTGAHAVADELAAAEIPVILNFRSAATKFEQSDYLVGPPLTKSSAWVLSEAGVKFALTSPNLATFAIHDHLIEASWAAKYSGLSEAAAVDLVSRNTEEILGLKVDENARDIVIYEGNPLEFGASVVLTIDGEAKKVVECWPEVQ